MSYYRYRIRVSQGYQAEEVHPFDGILLQVVILAFGCSLFNNIRDSVVDNHNKPSQKIQTMQFLFFCIPTSYLLLCCYSQMNKVILTDPSALCLDGSSAIYYIQKGTNPKNIVIYFQGGGWCGDQDLSSTLQNCYQRSKTYYGSTNNDSDIINPTDGIYSNNLNNHFRDATRVLLRYCDGSGHQGTKQYPISYKDIKLYFRGHNITIAQLDDLNRKQLIFTQAEFILVTGGSAGGLAAFLWADYIRERANTNNVVCAPDSGIFLDWPDYNTGKYLYSTKFQNLFKLSNAQIDPPIPDCSNYYNTSKYKCMMAQYLSQFLKTPVFPIQSLYDSWSIENILIIKCLKGSSLVNCNQKQKQYIQLYNGNTIMLMEQIAGRKGNGGWGIGCVTHGFIHDSRYYSANYRIPMSSPNSIDATLLNWVNNQQGQHLYIDTQSWPANKPCSGTSILRQS